MKKALFILGLTSALFGGSVLASSAAPLGNPTVSYTLRNNSSATITQTQISCAAHGVLPPSISSRETDIGFNKSKYEGMYSCQFTYSAGVAKSCKFTIARLKTPGNAMLGIKDQWKYPTIYLTSGGNCSGRITAASFNDAGDFSVELNYNF